MGLLDIFFKDDGTGNAPKDTKEEVVYNPSTFNMGNNFVPYNANASTTPVVSVPGQLSDADRSKWKTFFENLWAKLDDPRPSYNEFIAVCDGMGAALADNIKFPSVFQGFKAQGLSKLVLVSTAENMLQAMRSNATDFNNEIDKLRQKEVVALQQQIEAKQQQVVQLQKEIAELTTTATLAAQKLDNNVAGYMQYSGELQKKIANDIDHIKNMIPD